MQDAVATSLPGSRLLCTNQGRREGEGLLEDRTSLWKFKAYIKKVVKVLLFIVNLTIFFGKRDWPLTFGQI